MKVVVFGATGKTGDHCWRKTVVANHDVTVFGRSVERRYAQEGVSKAQGDVLDARAASSVVAGQDAVLVCLGPVGLKDRVTLSTGAAHIRDAMLEHGVKRLVFVSAAGVGDSWTRIPWYSKILFSTILKAVLASNTATTKTIPREDLAGFLVDQIGSTAHLIQAICVTSG